MDGLVQTRLPHGLDQTTSAGIQFYQKWLAAGLATRCTQMPSDSQYAQQSFQKCGAIVGTFKAMARVIQEPSASELGLPVLVQNQQIYFFDPLESCEIF